MTSEDAPERQVDRPTPTPRQKRLAADAIAAITTAYQAGA